MIALENESFLKLFFFIETALRGGNMKELEMNPYVIQMDKFVKSLEKLSHVFLHLEDKHDEITEEIYQGMREDVKERVCKHCEKNETCKEKDHIRELIYTIEHYGAELNVEVKRRTQKKCMCATQYINAVLDTYKNEKQNIMWKQRIAENREGCAIQLGSFAKMIRHTTKELNASIFEDEHLEKKIKARFSKIGIKLLSTVFLVSQNGRYEIHVTMKANKGKCIPMKEVSQAISQCVGRTMILERDERALVSTEYHTVSLAESSRFYALQGVAKIAKGGNQISGDNFSLLELAGSKQGVILSDGMGVGERAFRESAMVVEVLEELLNAGFPQETALQMLNTAMVMGREEVRFSTIDMTLFDMYTGKCSCIKAGASTTFLKRREQVELIKSTSLPLGVVSQLEIDSTTHQLEDGDVVIMMTDGVMDALPVGEQEFLMRMIVKGTNTNNPKEMAHYILEQVLECSGKEPLDDMTVVVIGIWTLDN